MSDEAHREADSPAEQKRRNMRRTAFHSWWVFGLMLIALGIYSAIKISRLFRPDADNRGDPLPALTKLVQHSPPWLIALGCLCIAIVLASRRNQFLHRLTHSLVAFFALGLLLLAIFAALGKGVMLYLDYIVNSPL